MSDEELKKYWPGYYQLFRVEFMPWLNAYAKACKDGTPKPAYRRSKGRP